MPPASRSQKQFRAPSTQALNEQQLRSQLQNEFARNEVGPLKLRPSHKFDAPSKSSIARELAVSEDKLAQYTRELSAYQRGQKTALDNSCTSQRKQSPRSLCALYDAIKATEDSQSRATRSSQARVQIRPHNFEAQQKLNYSQLLSAVLRESSERILAWAPQMTHTQGCPRNLSAAAIRKVEILLPSEQAKEVMNKLYEHAAACMQPTDDGYEITHFRQALLRHLWGDTLGARQAINRAVLAPSSGAESARTLYWAGLMQDNPRLQNSIWERLLSEHPLSYHALEVWRHRNQDPMAYYTRNLSLQPERNAHDALTQASLRWLEALHLEGHPEGARSFSRWMTEHRKSGLSGGNLVYMSLLKAEKNTTLNTISFLFSQISSHPSLLSDQTLRILYPKPFYETLEAASPNMDTYLVLSVARQESAFNPRARSTANARGLLQILPTTARMINGRSNNNLYDVKLNAELGVRFLGNLIERFSSVEKALAAYNAGPARIPTWQERYPTDDPLLFMDLIPFRETRNYVPNILRNNYWYARLYTPESQQQQGMMAKKNQHSTLVATLLNSHLSPTAGRLPAANPRGRMQLRNASHNSLTAPPGRTQSSTAFDDDLAL